jgi:hypothetical protein
MNALVERSLLRVKSKKYLLITSIFTILLVGIIFTSQKIRADDDDDIYCKLEIEYAGYGDFDDDKSEDDVIIIAKLKTNLDRTVKSYWYVCIILPSGKSYDFYFETAIKLDDDEVITIRIFALNTATELGWYNAGVAGYFAVNNGYIGVKDTITFDPPGGDPGGDPAIRFEVIY